MWGVIINTLSCCNVEMDLRLILYSRPITAGSSGGQSRRVKAESSEMKVIICTKLKVLIMQNELYKWNGLVISFTQMSNGRELFETVLKYKKQLLYNKKLLGVYRTPPAAESQRYESLHRSCFWETIIRRPVTKSLSRACHCDQVNLGFHLRIDPEPLKKRRECVNTWRRRGQTRAERRRHRSAVDTRWPRWKRDPSECDAWFI